MAGHADFTYLYTHLQHMIRTGGPLIDENYFISLNPDSETEKFWWSRYFSKVQLPLDYSGFDETVSLEMLYVIMEVMYELTNDPKIRGIQGNLF